MDDAPFVAGLVRDADRMRYLSVQYAPEAARRPLLALYAFEAEVGAIRDRVREPMAGEIRLQWWRDALAAPTGEATGNPAADELRRAVTAHGLPAAPLDALLEARIFDLYDDPMPDRATLEGYLGETRSAVIQLAMMFLDAPAAPRFADAAGHAGCVLGIVEILSALPVHRRRGQCFVPADLLAAAGTSRDALIAGEPNVAPALAAMVALGRDHLARFKAAATSVPAVLRPAFLPLASAAVFLDRTERLGVAALAAPARLSPLARQWRMFRAASRGW
jgi:phytoene synthase